MTGAVASPTAWWGQDGGREVGAGHENRAHGQPDLHLPAAASAGRLTNAGGRGFLDDAVLRERRPDLIHLWIRGRHDGRPAVDYTVNAAAGFPMVTGPPGHDGPVNHVLPAWDIACGLYAALGIAAADRHRARTGEGCFVRVRLWTRGRRPRGTAP